MNPVPAAARSGLQRGWIELRQTHSTATDLFTQYLWSVILLVVLYFMRDGHVQQTGIGLGSLALPGVLGMTVVSTGLLGIAQFLAVDREDGTLLRAKATPNGMVGYLIGKITTSIGTVLLQMVIMLIAGAALLGGVHLTSIGAWLTLAWVFVLGMLASLPLGAIVGSVFESPRALAFISLPIMGMVGVSGIFYPITSLPGWVQGLAQVFPIYWLGLGMRSALLPGDAVVVELGGSWRHWETLGVLGVWAAFGLSIAPIVLRRMARRESGSRVEARRAKALQRAV
ncbi:ABC transporter permease [Nocardia terpenica]|uniref:ABC transporter n=1 Tax=Nocardia terpenica TaxID=455432 RepID=A0A291RUM9_9NOCA|nr:ABC transporter permease [Nocardia terpenica]ATL71213.1 ABC transporter [Nocardia terpenica]